MGTLKAAYGVGHGDRMVRLDCASLILGTLVVGTPIVGTPIVGAGRAGDRKARSQ